MESFRVRARLAGCVRTVIFVLAGVFAMGKAADCLGFVLECGLFTCCCEGLTHSV